MDCTVESQSRVGRRVDRVKLECDHRWNVDWGDRVVLSCGVVTGSIMGAVGGVVTSMEFEIRQ